MPRQRRKYLHTPKPQPFSQSLETWLGSSKDTTLAGLNKVFAEKSFAIIFLLLMALPALPIPTGGFTHVTSLVAMLISLQLIVGRQNIWLPKRWLKINIGKFMSGKAIVRLIKVIQWFERLSRRRLGGLLGRRLVLSILGMIILVFTAGATVAPPFSGLDTLPSLGVVVISLALILEDALIVLIGIIIGAVGIGLELAAGTAIYSGILHFFT